MDELSPVLSIAYRHRGAAAQETILSLLNPLSNFYRPSPLHLAASGRRFGLLAFICGLRENSTIFLDGSAWGVVIDIDIDEEALDQFQSGSQANMWAVTGSRPKSLKQIPPNHIKRCPCYKVIMDINIAKRPRLSGRQ